MKIKKSINITSLKLYGNYIELTVVCLTEEIKISLNRILFLTATHNVLTKTPPGLFVLEIKITNIDQLNQIYPFLKSNLNDGSYISFSKDVSNLLKNFFKKNIIK